MAGIPLALNFDLGAPLPLDSRIVIAQFSQLNNINPKYSGMQVYAADTKKLYYLEDLPSNKWTEVITNSNLPSLPTSLVYTTGNQTIGGEKTFSTRPKVGTSGVLLQGEIPSLPSTLVYTTGDQIIRGEKEFNSPTIFSNLLESTTNKLIFNQLYTGRVNPDLNNDSTLGCALSMTEDGTIMAIGVNNYTSKPNGIPEVYPPTGSGIVAKCYIYTRETNNDNWEFKEEITRHCPVITNGVWPVALQSINFNYDGSILFLGVNERVEVYTGSKLTSWNNLKNTLTAYVGNGVGRFGSSVAFDRNCTSIAVSDPNNNAVGIGAGSIHVFTGSINNGWSLKQSIYATGTNLSYTNYGYPTFNDDGSVLFTLRRPGGQNFSSEIIILTGSANNGWNIKQSFSWGFGGQPGANISCSPDGSTFVFAKRESAEIWTGNKNNGWAYQTSLSNNVFYSTESFPPVKLSRDNEYILLGLPYMGGYAGGMSLYKKTSNNNFRLVQTLFAPEVIQQFRPDLGFDFRIGEGFFSSTVATDGNLNSLVVGAPKANILYAGYRTGCVGTNFCVRELGYAMSFDLEEQSLEINSQEANSPILNIKGEVAINSPFRPKYNNSGILVQGEAIEVNSDAQLNSLKFKNSSEFDSPYFISNYISGGTIQNPNLPNISIFSDLIGDLVSFTTTGTLFKDRPYVNGSGVLLQGESVISSPSLDPFFGNRPIRRLPVADTNYGGTTISGFLTNLFFPYLNTTISLNPFSIYTYGIDSLSSINFSSTITSNDDTVTGLAAFRGLSRVGGIDPISVNGTQTISQTATLSPNVIATTTSSCLSRVYITRSGVSTNIASNNLAIRFEPRYYFGLSANTSLTSGEIAQLQNIVGPNTNPNFYSYAINAKPSNVTTTFNNPTNQYLYLAYPGEDIAGDLIKDWGIVSSIVDTITFQQYTNEFQAMPNIQINLGTKTLTYRVYRSKLIWNIAAQFNLQFNL